MKDQKIDSVVYHYDDSQWEDNDGRKSDNGSKTSSKNVAYQLVGNN
jgi:hypothetical protein